MLGCLLYWLLWVIGRRPLCAAQLHSQTLFVLFVLFAFSYLCPGEEAATNLLFINHLISFLIELIEFEFAWLNGGAPPITNSLTFHQPKLKQIKKEWIAPKLKNKWNQEMLFVDGMVSLWRRKGSKWMNEQWNGTKWNVVKWIVNEWGPFSKLKIWWYYSSKVVNEINKWNALIEMKPRVMGASN